MIWLTKKEEVGGQSCLIVLDRQTVPLYRVSDLLYPVLSNLPLHHH